MLSNENITDIIEEWQMQARELLESLHPIATRTFYYRRTLGRIETLLAAATKLELLRVNGMPSASRKMLRIDIPDPLADAQELSIPFMWGAAPAHKPESPRVCVPCESALLRTGGLLSSCPECGKDWRDAPRL